MAGSVPSEHSDKIIDGKALALTIREELEVDVSSLKKSGISPHLTALLVGEDEASRIYIRHKRIACRQVGIRSTLISLPRDVDEEWLMSTIERLNDDPDVDGILLQLPLPEHLPTGKFLDAIDASKDVDGFHPLNLGTLVAGGKQHLQACTALGVMRILEQLDMDLFGKDVTVIGKSNLVGKPIAHHLLDAEATVTICHKFSQQVSAKAARADVLIVAVGVPRLVDRDWVKEGAVVIDVGINRLENGRVVGDVDFDAVLPKVRAITPVPGGVGPMTIAMLLHNTVQAAKGRRGLLPPIVRPRLWT